MTCVFYALVNIMLLAEVIHSQQLQGDLCTTESKTSGVCKLFNECSQAVEDLNKFQRYPQICGFQGVHPIVCCPLEKRKTGEISSKKCREYSKYVPANVECGYREQTPLIVGVGGTAAKKGEFPHMAAVGFEAPEDNIEWLCGGTLISEQYVLTAAHCTHSRNLGPAKYVRIGVTNLKNDSIHRQDIAIAERIPHPDKKNFSLYNDIALLKLERPAKMNFYTRPACLHLTRQIQAKEATAAGWGETEVSSRSDDLVKVPMLSIVDQQRCNSSYSNLISRRLKNGIVEDIQLCSGSLNDVKIRDTCPGDSGGPLQIDHDLECMYDIIGITSFGKGCGGGISIYTRVSHYVQWIEDIVWPDVS